jgi:hypothetical protein
MYRCHFTHGGHIVAGLDLEAGTLAEAISEAELGFAKQLNVERLGGFEIWKGSCLLHVMLNRSTSAGPPA